MDIESIDKGKLLYRERGNERHWSFWILLLAFVMGFAFFFMFHTIIVAVDKIATNENFARDLWWAPIVAFFYPQAVVYLYSIYLLLFGYDSLEIYEHGIKMRSSYIEGLKDKFLPFDEIEKITILYGGSHRLILKEYLNEMYYDGFRITTQDGKIFDISSRYSSVDIEKLMFYNYDIIQILPRLMGSRFNKFISEKPEITDEEWDDISIRSKKFFRSLEGYALKQSIIMSVLMIPVMIVLFLMFADILEEWVLLITILAAFSYVPFLSIKVLNYTEKTMFQNGILFRAQEYEMLTGEKIIPPGFEIPENHIYPDKDLPNIKEEFWKGAEEYLTPKSALKDSMKFITLRIVFFDKLENYLRYERLTKTRVIPEYIRQNEEVKKHISRTIEEYDKVSKKAQDRREMRKKMIEMYETLEDGRSITPDFNYKPVCFKDYSTQI